MSTTAERTDPDLWERVKEEITQSDKGGEPGQWSARKAQMATGEYKKRGGGYKGQKRADNSLVEWGEEDWGTKSGQPSTETGERYLPKKARESLSDEEYKRTTAKKRADKRKGKQFSAQPKDVAEKTAPHRGDGAHGDEDGPSRDHLLEAARALGVDAGRSERAAELRTAIAARVKEDGGSLSKASLAQAAKVFGVAGRSRMTKDELAKALAEAA